MKNWNKLTNLNLFIAQKSKIPPLPELKLQYHYEIMGLHEIFDDLNDLLMLRSSGLFADFAKMYELAIKSSDNSMDQKKLSSVYSHIGSLLAVITRHNKLIEDKYFEYEGLDLKLEKYLSKIK